MKIKNYDKVEQIKRIKQMMVHFIKQSVIIVLECQWFKQNSYRIHFYFVFLFIMGNHCQNLPSLNDHSSFKEINVDSTNEANVDCVEQFDNPKRNVLSSNFLAGLNYSSNYLQSIKINKDNHLPVSSRRFSLIKIDSIDIDKQKDPSVDFDDQENVPYGNYFDKVKQPHIVLKRQKRTSISYAIDFEELQKNTLFRETKNYIVSDKHIYNAIEIRQGNFISVKETNIENYYQFLGKIGEGTYGNVMKALCLKTNQFRAIKILKRQAQQRRDKLNPEMNLQELNILKKLDHPNIIKLFEVYYHNESYYLVTEYCQGGSILAYLRETREYCESIVKTIIKQLLSALSYIHCMKVAHRDIKLENIVFINKVNAQSKKEDVQIKIIDFGEALELRFPHNNKDRREVGTLTYMAPEVLEGLYSEKCDIWSCGVILWILLSGRNPFKRNSKRQTIDNIKSLNIHFKDDIWQEIPEHVKILLNRMLEKNPLKRITAKQALKNTWFSQMSQSINKDKMKNVVKKLYGYYRGNNLVSVVESYLSFIKITQEERAEITKLFKKIDTDNSGSIDINQLREAFMMCTEGQSNNEVEYVLSKIDKNKTKKIDLNEFITALYDRKKLFHQNSLLLAFDYFDNDKNGYIDKKELKTILKGCDQEQINKILNDIDQNGDKQISREQFITYIKEERFL